MTRLSEGELAPDFTATDHEGRDVTLEEMRGQRVVLYFYPADDTPGCTKEACQFNAGLADFADLDARVIGVSPDDEASHRAFRQKYGLRFDLVSDPERIVMTAYGAYGEKMMYGRRVQGVIRSTIVVGPTGRVEHAFYNVRADGHAAKVLAALARKRDG